MEGRAEPDGASSDQAASQRHAPSPGDAAEHVRELAGVPRADSSSTAVTHNGRVYVHYSTQPRSQAMDAADLAPETDSLAEDTESSTTTVVCDSRFFCATPDLPEQPDSLDPDCEMDARPDSSGSAQSLSLGPSASGGNSPEPDAAELGQNSHAARRSPSAAPKKAGAETETRVFSPSPLTSPPPDAEGELSPLPHNSVTTGREHSHSGPQEPARRSRQRKPPPTRPRGRDFRGGSHGPDRPCRGGRPGSLAGEAEGEARRRRRWEGGREDMGRERLLI